MSDKARTVVERQVRRAWRRLAWQTLQENLLICWSAALLVAALWFIVRPVTGLGEALRWTIPAMALSAATLLALARSWLLAPNRLSAALALDERFVLRERTTTLLTLPPAQEQTPVAQALLDDVHQRVGGLSISEKFPLTVPGRATLLLCGALLLAGLAVFFEPYLSGLRLGLPGAFAAPAHDVKQIQQELDELRKTTALAKDAHEPKAEDVKELESEWDKLINRPLDLNDQEKVRERLNDLRKLEDKLKDRLDAAKEKGEKNDALRRELDKLSSGDKKMQEGPAKDFHDALVKGEFAKAKDILDKLQKDLKDEKLTQEQQKQLADQFKQIQQKLEQLMQDNEALKQLEKDVADGKIDQDVLNKAMEQFEELQNLGDCMGDLAKALRQGNGDAISAALGKAMRQLSDIDLSDEMIKQLLKCDKSCDAAMKALLKAMQNGNGLGKGKMPGAERPIDPNDPDTNPKNERQKAEVDPKGQQRITGFVRGGSFSKIPARAVDGAFQQAVQEAPEAIDRQRIPDDAADIARGYFKKLANQKE